MKLIPILVGLLGAILLPRLSCAAPQPFNYDGQEKEWPYSLYAGDAYRACKSVNDARVARGLPELVESIVLANAGRRLIDHMLREDWVGTSFPSGYSLAAALAEVGYPPEASVKAVIRVSSVADFKGYFGSGYYTKAAAQACSVEDGFNPNLTAFGYFSIEPKSDPGRVDTNTPENGGGYYEVMLFGSLPPPVGARQLVNFYHVRNQYDIKPIALAANIVGQRGFLLNRSVVGSPAPRYIVGKARVTGRLPRGVKFNGTQARFYGIPKKKGNFRVRVTAKYRMRKDFTAEGTDGGVKTITVVLRVR